MNVKRNWHQTVIFWRSQCVSVILLFNFMIHKLSVYFFLIFWSQPVRWAWWSSVIILNNIFKFFVFLHLWWGSLHIICVCMYPEPYQYSVIYHSESYIFPQKFVNKSSTYERLKNIWRYVSACACLCCRFIGIVSNSGVEGRRKSRTNTYCNNHILLSFWSSVTIVYI